MSVRDLTLRVLLLDDGKVVLFTAKGGLVALNKTDASHVMHLASLYEPGQQGNGQAVPCPERSRELANRATLVAEG